MAWAYDTAAGYYFPSGTGTDNTYEGLHDYINSSAANDSLATSVELHGVYVINIGLAGIRTGPTTATETFTSLSSTGGTITSTATQKPAFETVGSHATFLVNYERTGTSPNFVYTPTNPEPTTVTGGLQQSRLTTMATNFNTPWFIMLGAGTVDNGNGWHHSASNGIMNFVDGSITYIDGVTLYMGDAPSVRDGAVGGITNSILSGSNYPYTTGGATTRGVIFQKYDSGTFSLAGTTMLGWEFLPNQAENYSGLNRRGSVAGLFNAGRADAPITNRNFEFADNFFDVVSENTTVGDAYPQVQLYNHANGSDMSWAWNSGGGNDNKGDIRLYRELDLAVSSFDDASNIEGSRVWIRDTDNGARKTLPASLDIGTSASANAQETDYSVLVIAQRDHLDKTYLITTGADGSASTWSFRGGDAAAVPTTGVPFQVMIASWLTGASLSTTFTVDATTPQDRLDKRTKGNVVGVDLIDAVAYRYGYLPAVVSDIDLVGTGTLTVPVVHFTDEFIKLTETQAQAGASGVTVTANGNVSVTAAMTLDDLYDYQAYNRYTDDALIEATSIPGFGNVVANSDGTTIDFGAGTLASTAALTAVSTGHTAVATTANIDLANFNLSGFTALTANNFTNIPLIPNLLNVTGLGTGTTGEDTVIDLTLTSTWNGVLDGSPESGEAVSFGATINISTVDAGGTDRTAFFEALTVNDTITFTPAGGTEIVADIASIQTNDNSDDGVTYYVFAIDDNFGFVTSGTPSFTFTQVDGGIIPGVDVPAVANELTLGGTYGATFLGGVWQLTAGQTYSFADGAFSNAAASLIGPDSGTATVNLGPGQTQADVTGSSTAIPNITFVANIVMYTVLPTIPDGFTGGGKFIVKRSTNGGTTWTEVNDRTITGGVLGGTDYQIPSTSTDMFRAYYKLDGELIGGSSTDWAITIETFTGASANRAVAPTLIPSVFTRDAPTTVTDSRTATFQNPTATSIELLWSGSLVELPADTYSALITAKNGATWIDWHADNNYTVERSEVGQSFGITWNNSVTGISGLPTTQGVIFISGTASANPQYQVAQQLGQNTRDTTLGSGIPQVFSTTVGNATLGTVLAAITPAVDNSTLLNTVAGDVMDTETKVTEVLADTTNLRQNKLLGLKPQVVKP